MDGKHSGDHPDESEGGGSAPPSDIGSPPERPLIEAEVVDDDIVDAIANVLPEKDRESTR